MQKTVSITCPKCNNNHLFYRYGKDKYGFQKYLCLNYIHQFAPDKPNFNLRENYPKCPLYNKATFLHHDYVLYSNYRCGDKKCNHSMLVPKFTSILPASISNLVGKQDFKRMRYSIHIILTALSMLYLGKNSFRNIALILKIANGIKVSHTTISNWYKKFTAPFNNLSLEIMPMLNFYSDEWHADETVVRILSVKHYIWFIVDSETRFVLGFHLSPYRDSNPAWPPIIGEYPLLLQADLILYVFPWILSNRPLHGAPGARVS